jgi:hypothetical protein
MSQTAVRLIDFPCVGGSTSAVHAQSPQEPQADQTTADVVGQARPRRRSVAQNPLLHYPLGKINRSTLPSQVSRFSGQKLRGLISDCCRISLRGNQRGMLFLENLIRALLIFNRLRSRHCQRALLGYHYPNFGGPACVLPARSCRRATRKRLFKRAGAGKIIAFFDIGHYLE